MDIDSYIKKLTLAEKAALLQGRTNWRTWHIPRLRIPSVYLSDGPHGLRRQTGNADHLGIHKSVPATCFPTAATMANAWNPELGEQLGEALGKEAAANRVHVLLGPALNMKRSPLCGRNFEYFSEDPYLAGKLAAAYIRGIQKSGVAACPKHFAVNSQELRRMSSDSVVDERTLREIYLTAFEIAVTEGKPRSIMTSYNRINGVYANENSHLLRDILRKEWGFDGFVVTDWGASNSHVAGVRAGSNLEMPCPGADSALCLMDAVEAGEIPESELDARLRELLPVLMEAWEAVEKAPESYNADAHHDLARRCAEEAIVLLENDGLLPLKPGTKAALIGEFAEMPRYQGAGSSLVNPTRLETLKDALSHSPITITGYAPGYRSGAREADQTLIDQAVALAKEAPVVLLCMGLDNASECEGLDRTTMALPTAQTALLRAVSRVNPNIVLILSGGAPFSMPPKDRYRAAIHGYLSGQAGAPAMADALCGKCNPSGALAETWPMALEDTPTHPDFPAEQETVLYREGPYIGYRYYDTARIPVRYPFGYGLSYTRFAYADLQADSHSVTFTLTNLGHFDGAEVAQVYVSCRNGKVFRPKKELKGFQKVYLKAGESRRVTISLDSKAFRYFNTVTGKFEQETANYDIIVASDAATIRLQTTIRVFGTDAPVPEADLPHYCSAQIREVTDEEFEALLGRPIPEKEFDALTLTSTVAELSRAKSPAARLFSRVIRSRVEAGQKRGKADLNDLFIYNMPLRAFWQMTDGKITRKMTLDLLYLANGHFFKGLYRFVRDYFLGRQEAKAFLNAVENPYD